MPAVVEERPVDEDPVDEPDVARAGGVGGEADGAAALLHLGLLDHAHRGLVAQVVDAGDPGARVDLGLRVAVRLGRAVPVVVIVGEVQAHAGQRGQSARAGGGQVVQLEARELDDEHVEAGRVAHGVEHGHADVAAGRDARSALLQHRGRQLGRRGLAVRAGDEDPLRGRCDLVPHAPGELDVAPDGHSLPLGPLQKGMLRPEARRHDEQLGLVGGEGRDVGRVVSAADLDEIDADHGQDPRALLVGRRGRHEHPGPELGEGVGDGEAGDAEAEHDDAQLRPVGVPAGQLIEARHATAPPIRGRTGRRPTATRKPPMSQNRTTTVTSAQPLSSKWWCSGLMRKMRLPPLSLK